MVTFAPPAGLGAGINLVEVGSLVDLAAAGYVEAEWFAQGTARSFQATEPLSEDGRWNLTAGTDEASFCTRLIVRRPADPSAASGTVIVEWLNVSSGLDAGPEWAYAGEAFVRDGHVWVGVSAQHIGVCGGDAAVGVLPPGFPLPGLPGTDPERYTGLHHPGDAYAFDLFTQIGAGLRDDPNVLGGIEVRHLIAAGESQSAFALTTYFNGVHPDASVFDGFFLHSRSGSALPLDSDGPANVILAVLGEPARLRDDSTTPVFVFQTESDVLSPLFSVRARQSDHATLRTWEVAGTAHVDHTLLGPIVPLLECGDINDGHQEFPLRAAWAHCVRWVAEGIAPPTGEPLAVADDQYLTDADGLTQGGVRTPFVDVPTATLSGAPAVETDRLVCHLAGSTVRWDADALADRYGSREQYLDQVRTNAELAVVNGFLLEADLDQLLSAAADRWPTP